MHDNDLPGSESQAIHEEEEQQEETIEISEDVRTGEERDLHSISSSSSTSSTSTSIPHQLHHRHSPEEDAPQPCYANDLGHTSYHLPQQIVRLTCQQNSTDSKDDNKINGLDPDKWMMR